MPVRMALNDLVDGIETSLHSYWGIRAANAAMIVFSNSEIWSTLSLDFENIPLSAEITPPSRTNFTDLRGEIERYFTNGRASTDYFMSIISQFETFLTLALRAKLLSEEGTLGALTTRAETAYLLSSSSTEVQVVAEIRERRNAIIHNHGKVNARYLRAASAPLVISSFGGISIGHQLKIDDAYLVRAADGLIGYARKF